MKASLIPIALLALVAAACSAPESGDPDSKATNTADTGEMMPGTEMQMSDFAKVNDDMAGPVFIDPERPADVAVSGYDAVSYFEGESGPVKGSKEFGVNYNDVNYYFASADNATKFKAEPAKYAPQYGGHCAWAMSRGRLAPGDAQVYRIVDGKLYLNFSKTVQEMWEKDISGFIKKADAAWPSVPADASFDNQ